MTYVQINNQRQGPFSDSVLDAMAADGTINEETPAQAMGMEEWVPLRNVWSAKAEADARLLEIEATTGLPLLTWREKFESIGLQRKELTAVPVEKLASMHANAHAGDHAEQFKLGELYAENAEREIDKERAQRFYATAYEWLAKASEGGFLRASLHLAKLYTRGDAFERNEAVAAWFLMHAAGDGDAEAKYELGRVFCSGFGVPQDTSHGESLIWQAAHAGNRDACYFVAGLCKSEVAIQWYQRALKLGHPDAQVALNKIYHGL